MAVRFLENGYEYLDPMSGASTAGSAFLYEDAAVTPPWEIQPSASMAERAMSDALRWMNIPADELRMQRPPVPQMLFPPRLGYSDVPLTIDDVFSDNWRPQQRSWVSGPPRTPRRAFEEDTFSGTMRNSSGSVNPML